MSKPHYPPRPSDPLLTTGEVATRLGVSLRTIQLWAKDGKLPGCTTPGGHRRFRLSAVAAFAEAHGMHFAALVAADATATEIERDLLQASLSSLLSWCKKFGLSGQPVDHAAAALASLSATAT